MARKKSEKRSGGTKSKKRQTTLGRIHPMLDVQSENQFGEMMKRINSGPLTIIFAYANWCGHCSEFAPHFNKAADSSKRSVQVVKINDEMLPSANEHIMKNTSKNSKPLNNISGYPSVLVVDNEGSLVTNIEPIRDTNRLKNFMEKSGNAVITTNEPFKKSNKNMSSPMATQEQDLFSSSPIDIADDPSSVVENSVPNTIVTAPNFEEDIIPNEHLSESARARQTPLIGGNLFDALSTTASTLAPAGILLALASQMTKGRFRSSSPFSRKRRVRRRGGRSKTARHRVLHK